MTNPVVIKNYFDDLENQLTTLDFKIKSSQIWICDETGRSSNITPLG